MTETSATRPAVLCIGETMVVLATQDEPLGLGAVLRLAHAGAESNVAAGLASLGTPVEWYSRLGDDAPGQVVLDSLRRAGVDTRGVRIDTGSATGLCLKDVHRGVARVHYYRRGSAASHMNPDDAAGLDLGHRAIVHITGVSAALSPTALDLLNTVIVQARPLGYLVSFDVNHRAALWASREEAATTLLGLSRTSDICLVGRDEAEGLWGTRTADEIRALLGHTNHLVVKDSAEAACAYLPGNKAAEAAVAPPFVDIVDAVGAGDAFAAGYLHGYITGSTTAQSLGLGHAMAGRVIGCRTDTAEIGDARDVVAMAQSLAGHATGRRQPGAGPDQPATHPVVRG